MNVIYKAVVVLLLCVVVVFAVQNLMTVTVSFLSWSATIPLAIVVIAAYVLGMVTGGGVLSLLMRSMHDDTKKVP